MRRGIFFKNRMPASLFLRLGFCTLLGLPMAASATPRPSAIFSDHAVLQADQKVPLWGTASPGEKISIQFAGKKVEAVADEKGNWKTELPPLEAGTTGELSFVGETTFTAKDVLVGDVWLCSGQSNMGLSIKRSENGPQEIAAANYPKIRMFRLERTASKAPVAEPNAKWVVCSPESVAGWTAVGYFFGRDIFKARGIPVGLIQASWGGTDIEGWSSAEAVDASGSGKAVRERWAQLLADYPKALAAYEALMAQSKGKAETSEGEGEISGRGKPKKPPGPDSPSFPGNLFNGMISPLIPYAIRGIIWYQGENNTPRTSEYGELLTHLIRDWRQRWGNAKLPFLYVQLPNFPSGKPMGTGWAEFRDVQAAVLTEPETRMAVTIDLGSSETVHPIRKREVGERLSWLARKHVYGEQIPADAPVFVTARRDGASLKMEFKRDKSPLVFRKAGDNSSFEIAGEDKKFVPAEVSVEGDAVVLSSPRVPNPVFVRYAWKNDPPVTLFDSAGLPARPFRTDP